MLELTYINRKILRGFVMAVLRPSILSLFVMFSIIITSGFVFAEDTATNTDEAASAISAEAVSEVTPVQVEAAKPESVLEDSENSMASKFPPPVKLDQEEGNEKHKHRGIYVRFSVGPGFSLFKTSYKNTKFTLMSAAVVPELSMGFSPAENLELTFGLTGTMMAAPELTVETDDGTTKVSKDLSSNNMISLVAGGGLMYYFMPINIYVGANVGLSYMNLRLNDDIGDIAKEAIARHRIGFAAGISAGKEWWVAKQSGLGVGVQYQLYVFPNSVSDDIAKTIEKDTVIWLGHTVSLMLTATYN